MEDLADLVLLAGQLILENGGETFRVEETMVRMALAGGAQTADVFAIPQGIFCTINEGLQTHTRVVRIHNRGFNLAKVLEVNRISRQLSEGILTVESAYNELLKVERLPRRYPTRIRLLAGAIGSATFSYLLGAHVGSVIVAGITGFLVLSVMEFLQNREVLNFISLAIAGVITAIANLTVKQLWPALEFDLAIVGSIMVLVPGLAITTSVRDALFEDLVSASIRGVEAFGVALSIASGVGAVLTLYLWVGGTLP
ncbi:threonine/serine exporter family protein [Desulfosporosinus metallidurans]|uniref:Membrane spanning protein n=1 Tax=Desulfosporosinus metallidurans TaxID=1888891 RepID=A0A1Q8QLF2_9FIRM|nr:threonine/serine exporter family protein [Desulfosporosinus metallidurans]OLN28166.1 Membrane spanning protein [Desulfosporosinus metallidurans]